MARKTEVEHRQERAEAEAGVWKEFRTKLVAVQTPAEAKAILSGMPSVDAAGRHFYTSLQFFLESLAVPGGANGDEILSYISLIQRFEASGMMKPETRQATEKALKQALLGRGWQPEA